MEPMNRISQQFSTWKARGHRALIPFLTAGYPVRGATPPLLRAVADAGADVIEVGIPFSDPLADGPVIQASSFRSLQTGTRVTDAFRIVEAFRRSSDVPVVYMTYYNLIHAHGPERFVRAARSAGADGLIVADLIPEEGGALGKACRDAGLALTYLCAPTSPAERIRLAARATTGFLYLVSLRGVTGARKALPSDLKTFVARARRATDKPLCVGFGISDPAQAAQVARIADGVIVGSALLKEIAAARSRADQARRAGRFIAALRRAVP